jgi:hypothetical protein
MFLGPLGPKLTFDCSSASDQGVGRGVGVGVGVGVTEAVAAGEGDCSGVAMGLGVGMNSRRSIVSLLGVAVAVPVCDPVFVFALAPVRVVTAELLLGEPSGTAVILLAWLLMPICAPGLVCDPIFGTLGTVVPVRGTTFKLPLEALCCVTVPVVAAGLLLPLVPVRGVCAKLNGIVATHITITPSLIDVIRFILFSLRSRRPSFRRPIFDSLKYSA